MLADKQALLELLTKTKTDYEIREYNLKKYINQIYLVNLIYGFVTLCFIYGNSGQDIHHVTKSILDFNI